MSSNDFGQNNNPNVNTSHALRSWATRHCSTAHTLRTVVMWFGVLMALGLVVSGCGSSSGTATPTATTPAPPPATSWVAPSQSVNPPASWSSTVAIQVQLANGTSAVCSGSLIAPNVVLTAAHCAYDESTNQQVAPSALQVFADLPSSMDTGNTQSTTVTNVAIYPKWTPTTLDGDVAVLTLGSSATSTPIPLANAVDQPWAYAPGTDVWFSGFGPSASTQSPVWHDNNLAMQSDAACSNAIGADFHSVTMFCAEIPGSQLASCHGDSGGPVLALSPTNTWTEIGLVSWGGTSPVGSNCPSPPGVYVRLGSPLLNAWIRQQVAMAASALSASGGTPQPPAQPAVDTTTQSSPSDAAQQALFAAHFHAAFVAGCRWAFSSGSLTDTNGLTQALTDCLDSEQYALNVYSGGDPVAQGDWNGWDGSCTSVFGNGDMTDQSGATITQDDCTGANPYPDPGTP